MNGLNQVDSLDQIGVARQRAKCVGTIGIYTLNNLLLQAFQVWKCQPTQLLLEILPDTLSRIEFGTGRWLEYNRDIGWQFQALGSMRAAIVHHYDVKGGGMSLGKLIYKQLHMLSIERR